MEGMTQCPQGRALPLAWEIHFKNKVWFYIYYELKKDKCEIIDSSG